jgi:hypothetical protein
MVASPSGLEIDRPLRLGELLAAAVRIFSARPWPFLLVGVVEAVAFLAGSAVHWLPGLAILSITFVAGFAFVARIVQGDELAPAWRAVAATTPVLLVLALVVAVPFYLGASWLVLLIFSAGWLGLTAFSVPAAVVEPTNAAGWLGRAAYALRRTRTLAATDYVHAAGVSAALIVIYVLVGVALAAALASYAENSRLVAQALTQIVLAPFFFIGLTVLYFEQRARSVESAGKPARKR